MTVFHVLRPVSAEAPLYFACTTGPQQREALAVRAAGTGRIQQMEVRMTELGEDARRSVVYEVSRIMAIAAQCGPGFLRALAARFGIATQTFGPECSPDQIPFRRREMAPEIRVAFVLDTVGEAEELHVLSHEYVSDMERTLAHWYGDSVYKLFDAAWRLGYAKRSELCTLL